MNLLEAPFVRRVRRNHGLEHATIHVLSTRFPGQPLAGRSTPNGFYLYGNLAVANIASAAEEALARLRAGEQHLAIHPGCGTNYLTSGAFAGVGAFAALSLGGRNKWERLPNAIMAATFALILAAPVGPLLQARVTTSGEMADLQILSVRRLPGRGVPTHFVATKSS
ncbi:MAG TPA: DUF6391 domain-containing protein [Anaerolineae bacterium]|nr:DUF6391 domain-containing protein [Anaerolineae bacterium]